jgi:hypothetical protein
VEKLLKWEIGIDFGVCWANVYRYINILENGQPSLSFALAFILKRR